MPRDRAETPYSAFNFRVAFPGEEAFGGFSDVSGINTEFTISEYRNGNESENQVRKIPGIYKVGDVTLKRGVVNSTDVWTWFKDVRQRGPDAQRDVVITLLDEAGDEVQSWKLRYVAPLRYTGPTLAAKGGGDVAMEELVLAAEGIEIEAA